MGQFSVEKPVLPGSVLSGNQHAGLAKLGHVALDGTKIKANASKHRKQPTRKRTNCTAQAVAATKCPAGSLTNRSAWPKSARPDRRLRRRPQLPRRRKPKPNARRRRNARRRTASARGLPRPPSKEPDPKAQRNFTDPDSRVLLTKDGFIQGYNAQAAVDGAKQIIVAHGLTQSMSDCPQLVPLVDAVRANLGRKPREISADAGYCSEDNLLGSRPGRSTPMSRPGEPSIRPRPRARSAAR